MSLAILFHFLCAQHVSDINISIIRSLRLFCWITTLVELFLVRWYPCCRLKHNLFFSPQHGYYPKPTTPKLQHTCIFFIILYYVQKMHIFFLTNYHTPTRFDTIVSSSGRLHSIPCQVTQVFQMLFVIQYTIKTRDVGFCASSDIIDVEISIL